MISQTGESGAASPLYDLLKPAARRQGVLRLKAAQFLIDEMARLRRTIPSDNTRDARGGGGETRQRVAPSWIEYGLMEPRGQRFIA